VANNYSQFLAMKTLRLPKAVKLNIEQILYLESDSNYTYIYSQGQRKYTVALSLCKVQDSLSFENFVCINCSHIINTQNLKGGIRIKIFWDLPSKTESNFALHEDVLSMSWMC
jgi:DNA-binding LytR/AlgR family response regulator